MRSKAPFLFPAVLLMLFGIGGRAGEPSPAPWLEVDHRSLVSQADLVYESPAARSVEGQPIGNGRMGTLVWTRPDAVHFQINRNDVFAVNRNHVGAQFDPTDNERLAELDSAFPQPTSRPARIRRLPVFPCCWAVFSTSGIVTCPALPSVEVPISDVSELPNGAPRKQVHPCSART